MMRILIAEDDREFRGEFVELITHCHPSWRIATAADAIEVHARMAASCVDLVFLDLQLSGLHSHLDLAALRRNHPRTKIVGLGDTNDSATIIGCFEAGLGGYISRTCSGIKLIRTIKVIATPDLFISTGSSAPAETAKRAPRRLIAERPAPAPLRPPAPPRASDPPHHPLTARQADVLNLLAEGRSTKDIARRLGLAVPTVKTHLAAVYRQLGARNRLQAVVKASALATSSATLPPMASGAGRRETLERIFAAG